jgi:hypothetical protein
MACADSTPPPSRFVTISLKKSGADTIFLCRPRALFLSAAIVTCRSDCRLSDATHGSYHFPSTTPAATGPYPPGSHGPH